MCKVSDNVERLVDGTRVQQQCSACYEYLPAYQTLPLFSVFFFAFFVYGFMRIVKSSRGNEKKNVSSANPHRLTLMSILWSYNVLLLGGRMLLQSTINYILLYILHE